MGFGLVGFGRTIAVGEAQVWGGSRCEEVPVWGGSSVGRRQLEVPGWARVLLREVAAPHFHFTRVGWSVWCFI